MWNREGTRVIFSSLRGGNQRLYWQAADGTGAPEPLTEDGQAGTTQQPQAVSADGAQLVYREGGGRGGINLRVLSLTGNHTTQDLLSTEFIELNAEVSPNGRWLAYQSNRDGQPNAYVSPFPAAGSRQWKISPAGGTRPAWAPNGRELYYIDTATQKLMSARVALDQPAFVFDPPQAVLDVSGYWFVAPGRTYDVDTGRFVFLKDTASRVDARPQIHIVQHWVEELKRRVPTK